MYFSKSHDLTVVTNTVEPPELLLPKGIVTLKHVNIVRKISLINDIIALYKLVVLFNDGKFT